MAVTIEVIRGPDKGRTFQVDSDAIIGRQSDTLALIDGTVSRQHAHLTKQNDTWIIEDLNSANGTFVNGIRIKRPTPLHLGDQIRCGTTLLVFGGSSSRTAPSIEVDHSGKIVDAAIMARIPASDDSVIIPTPELGAQAIGNLRTLYELTTELSSIFDLDGVLQKTVDVIFKSVPVDRAFILLIGDDGELIPKVARYRDNMGKSEKDTSSDESDATSVHLPISRTIINEVITKQEGILSSNAMRDKRFRSGQSVHEYGIRSAICTPIKGRDKILGVIHIDCSVSDHVYSAEQLSLLTAIGYQVGLAVENVRLYKEAVKSARLAAVGETVAFLSHHIKNILQALIGAAELVEKAISSENVEKAKKAWPVVSRNLGRINSLVLNMLAFSKSRRPAFEAVDVNEIIKECVELLSSEADEKSVAMMTDLNDLPTIPADPDGLHQVILNLLTNAIDSVEENEGIITVSSKLDSLNQQVIIQVSDNGKGIEPDEIGKIFDIFHSTKGQKGTGLGLAVAKKIITEHSGTISVESTPGEGATFIIKLPLHPSSQPSPDDTHTP